MSRTLGALALAASLSSGAVASGGGLEEPARETERPIEPTAEELRQFTLSPDEVRGDARTGSLAFEIAGWGMVAASAADLGTTEWGLSRGLTEANPVASDRGLRVLHHVVGPAAVWWTTERLNQSGRTKLALSLRIALMAAYGYATFHNARSINGLP